MFKRDEGGIREDAHEAGRLSADKDNYGGGGDGLEP